MRDTGVAVGGSGGVDGGIAVAVGGSGGVDGGMAVAVGTTARSGLITSRAGVDAGGSGITAATAASLGLQLRSQIPATMHRSPNRMAPSDIV